MKRPSELQAPCDLHMFRRGTRPLWEDTENRNGGKWVLRIRKEYSDRLWEDLCMGIVGNAFGDVQVGGGDAAAGAADGGEATLLPLLTEHCPVTGCVMSIRETHDVLSLWVNSNTSRNKALRDKVRDVMMSSGGRVFKFPHVENRRSIVVEWRYHE
jgi:translation initiation factor 4E